jgi:hypothetical protein
VSGKKKELKTDLVPPSTSAKAIRLKPSISDYATFVKTTSAAMGVNGPAARKTKPNLLVLSLANLGYSRPKK